MLRMLQYFLRFQFQHERVRRVATIPTRLATAEILAGVRRWGFESDAAAMAAEAETICLCQGSRLAQRVCVVCSRGPGACGRYGKETAASRGRRCSRFCWKRASASLVAAPARPTARAALLPLGVWGCTQARCFVVSRLCVEHGVAIPGKKGMSLRTHFYAYIYKQAHLASSIS